MLGLEAEKLLVVIRGWGKEKGARARLPGICAPAGLQRGPLLVTFRAAPLTCRWLCHSEPQFPPL